MAILITSIILAGVFVGLHGLLTGTMSASLFFTVILLLLAGLVLFCIPIRSRREKLLDELRTEHANLSHWEQTRRISMLNQSIDDEYMYAEYKKQVKFDAIKAQKRIEKIIDIETGGRCER